MYSRGFRVVSTRSGSLYTCFTFAKFDVQEFAHNNPDASFTVVAVPGSAWTRLSRSARAIPTKELLYLDFLRNAHFGSHNAMAWERLILAFSVHIS